MPLYEFLKNLLGMPSYRPDDFNQTRFPNDNYEEFNRGSNYNNTWDDEEESGEPPMHFHSYSDPVEMQRLFEQQIGEFLRNFGGFFGNSSVIFGGFNDTVQPSQSETFTQTDPQAQTNLRNHFLKPGYSNTKDDIKPGISRTDSDIDGKVNLQDVDDMLKERPSKQEIVPHQPSTKLFSPQCRFSGSSMSSKTIRKADGSIETHNTVRNSDGSAETTITKQLGDKQYRLTTRTDKDGRQEKVEDMVNLDEKDVTTFTNTFQNDSDPNLDINKWFPFDKFFK